MTTHQLGRLQTAAAAAACVALAALIDTAEARRIIHEEQTCYNSSHKEIPCPANNHLKIILIVVFTSLAVGSIILFFLLRARCRSHEDEYHEVKSGGDRFPPPIVYNVPQGEMGYSDPHASTPYYPPPQGPPQAYPPPTGPPQAYPPPPTAPERYWSGA